MKLKNIILNSVIGTITLFLGLGVVGVWNFVTFASTSRNNMTAINVPPVPINVHRVPASKELDIRKAILDAINRDQGPSDTVRSNTEPNSFFDGYYLVIGDLPDGFKDFRSMEIWTSDYIEKDDEVVTNAPTGEFETDRKFIFDSVFKFVYF